MTMKCSDPQKLSPEQVVEAIRIIDGIGDAANKCPNEIASQLNEFRKRLKVLVNEIDGTRNLLA
jgi:hypothetical protein